MRLYSPDAGTLTRLTRTCRRYGLSSCSMEGGAPEALIVVGDGREDLEALAALAHAADGRILGYTLVSEYKRYNAPRALATALDVCARGALCALLILDQEEDRLGEVGERLGVALGEHGFETGDPVEHEEGRLLDFGEARRGSKAIGLLAVVSGKDGDGGGRRHAIEDHLLSAAGIPVVRDPKEEWRDVGEEDRRRAIMALSTQESARLHAPQHYEALSNLCPAHVSRIGRKLR